ncbi:GNAT family N-acetyltransferase [Streptomyces sp. NPDC051940]|uniref:GNAT family N-acetyltransferase n=1 Tax=Streptomyces sp. NPDC051940 TaxID=3155675 RepID=UPI00341B271F
MTDLRIRPARADELDVVEGLLIEASGWLASRGIDQWQFPPHRDRITRALSRGEVFLAFLDNELAGTLQLDEYADPEFWEPEDEPEKALYIHRMAVSRSAAGQGVGAKMLDWAAQRAAQSGRPLLRLDAWKTNSELQRYYAEQGFGLVRVVDLPHRGSGALFQRRVF